MNTSLLNSETKMGIKRGMLFCLGLFSVLSVFFLSTKAVLADAIIMDGHVWAFSFVIPTNETILRVNFVGWVNGSSGISPGSNIQIYSPQSSNAADGDNVITINNATGYSGKLQLVPGGGDDKVIRVIVQAYSFAGSSRTGAVMPTAEYVDAKGHTVIVQALSNIPTMASVITTINIASTTANLTVGETQQLTAEALDQFGNHFNTTLVWDSDNTSVATVDSTGLVTAISVGIANVTASSGSTTSNISVITVATSTEQTTPLQATSSDQSDENTISTTTVNTNSNLTASSTFVTSSTSTPVIDPTTTSNDTQATSTDTEATSTISSIPDMVSSSTPAINTPDASTSTPLLIPVVEPLPPAVASSTPVAVKNTPPEIPIRADEATTTNP